MDIFFTDPAEVPLPPDEVRIRALRAEPWPDGRRVRVYLEVDPFQKRPSVDLTILNAQQEPVAVASIIESMDRKMDFTMHLRGAETAGTYRLQVALYYSEPFGPAFEPPIEPPTDQSSEPPVELPDEEQAALPERQVTVVDRAETEFTIEA